MSSLSIAQLITPDSGEKTMKIIALGDIHMATSRLADIEGLALAELVIITGDITNFGSRTDAKTVLNEILCYNKNLLCLAGNLDNKEVNDYLDNLSMNIHGQAHMVKRKVCVYGVGGSNPTPFQTPWEFSETELLRIAEEGHRQATELIELAEPLVGHPIPQIFVSHSPPHGTAVDQLKDGRHVGSKSIRRFLEKNNPEICISSHIHEAKGHDLVGTTPVVNPGMLAGGGWVNILIEHSTIQFTLQ